MTRTRADGTVEYLCPTTGRWYVPTFTSETPASIWAECTECDANGNPRNFKSAPQAHRYDKEASHD